MKKVITFLILLAVCLSYKEGNAQPTRIWSSYYGNYTTYTPASYTVMGTAVFQVISDKKNHCIYMLGETTDSSGIATPGSFKENYLAPKMGSGFFTFMGGTSSWQNLIPPATGFGPHITGATGLS